MPESGIEMESKQGKNTVGAPSLAVGNLNPSAKLNADFFNGNNYSDWSYSAD